MPRRLTSHPAPASSDRSAQSGRSRRPDEPHRSDGFADPRRLRSDVSLSDRLDQPEAGGTGMAVRPKVISFSERQEERKKAGRRHLIKRVLVLVLILALVFALVWGLFFSSLLSMRVGDVTIEGTNAWVTKDMIASVVKEQEGKSILLVDANRMSKEVAAIPGASGIDLRRRPLHGLTITVKAQKPTAILKDPSNQMRPVDAQGRMMTADKASVQGIPVISVTNFDLALRTNAVKEAIKVLAGLPESLRSQIASTTAKTQDSVTTTLTNGYIVIWGNSSQIAFKTAVVQRTLQTLRTTDGNTYRVIDASAPDNPIVRQSLETKK